MVWHHRRNSVRAYWKQQKGYGKAEALLERKWPQKYNPIGHLTWNGRLYGKGLTKSFGWRKSRIYHGTWGSAPFQSLYGPRTGILESLPLMPEWYMVNIALAVLSALGLIWKPLLLALPLLVITASAPLLCVIKSVARASFTSEGLSRSRRLKLQFLTGLLHVLQPIARLYGRLRHRLTPWRRRGASSFKFPWPRTSTVWSERWQAPEKRLESIEVALRAEGAIVRRGGDFDRWDLEVRGGLFGAVRMRMAIEEHGAGRQLMRLRSWPKLSTPGLILILVVAMLSALAGIDQAWPASAILGLTAVLLAVWAFGDYAAATASYLETLKKPGIREL